MRSALLLTAFVLLAAAGMVLATASFTVQ